LHPTLYDFSADIWSVGITVLELAEKKPPLSHIPPVRVLTQIPLRSAPRFSEPGNWSPEIKQFLELCLQKDPAHRATCSKLLSHDFLLVRLNILVTRQTQKQKDDSPLLALLSEVANVKSALLAELVEIPATL
jgi:serine/threonine protein kinase